MDESSYKVELLTKELDEAFYETNLFANKEQADFESIKEQNFSNFDERTNSPLEENKIPA